LKKEIIAGSETISFETPDSTAFLA